jgi:hypothetical protein
VTHHLAEAARALRQDMHATAQRCRELRNKMISEQSAAAEGMSRTQDIGRKLAEAMRAAAARLDTGAAHAGAAIGGSEAARTQDDRAAPPPLPPSPAAAASSTGACDAVPVHAPCRHDRIASPLPVLSLVRRRYDAGAAAGVDDGHAATPGSPGGPPG